MEILAQIFQIGVVIARKAADDSAVLIFFSVHGDGDGIPDGLGDFFPVGIDTCFFGHGEERVYIGNPRQGRVETGGESRASFLAFKVIFPVSRCGVGRCGKKGAQDLKRHRLFSQRQHGHAFFGGGRAHRIFFFLATDERGEQKQNGKTESQCPAQKSCFHRTSSCRCLPEQGGKRVFNPYYIYYKG